MDKNPKKTLLHEWHMQQDAAMAVFGGYDMPLWYGSSKTEHLRVLTRAGLFDTSHMAAVTIEGPDAFELLQTCMTADMSACVGKQKRPLHPERCVYGAFLNEKGEVVDDVIIFQMAQEEFMAVVNAGMGGPIAEHLKSYKKGKTVSIVDLTDNLGKFDIQGPASAKVMSKVLADPDSVFASMPYFSFKGHFDAGSTLSRAVRLTDGTPILLSRTGYTGEFGFEIFVAPEHFVKAWETVLEAGAEFDVIPCGLAARDSLRAGAVLPLSHQDIGHWPFVNHPWTFALPYHSDRTGFTKSFVGDKALLAAAGADYTLPFAGNDLRKVSLPAAVLNDAGEEIGTVLTCATDMGIARHEGRIYSIASPDKPERLKIKGLCCGFVKVGRSLSPGEKIILKDSRRKIKAEIASDIRPHRTARCRLKEML